MSENTTKKNESMDQVITENLTDSIFIVLDWKIRFANKSAIERWGYTKEELSSANFDFMNLIHPSYRDAVRENEKRRLDGEELPQYKIKVVTKSGKDQDVLVKSQRITYQGMAAILVVFTDTILYAAVENEIKRSYDLINSISNFAGITDNEGRLRFANRKTIEELGFSEDELIGMPFWECGLFKPSSDMVKTIRDSIEASLRGETRRFEIDVFKKSGDTIPVYYTSTPMFDDENAVIGVALEGMDISELKERNKALNFEREQLLSIFDSIKEIIYVSDPQTYEILYVNSFTRDLFKKELVGSLCYKELHGLNSPCEFCTNEIILKEKYEPYNWVYYNPILKKSFSIVDRIIKWPDGRDVRSEIAIDVTDRKQAKDSLKRSEATYKGLIKDMNEGLVAIDEDGYITIVNGAFCLMIEYREEELIGMHITELLDDANREILERELEKRKLGIRSTYEITWTAKSGRKIPTSRSASPFFDSGVYRGSYGVVTDLSEIREIEDLYITILDAASSAKEGIALIQDLDEIEARYVYVNDYYAKLLGYSKEELYNMSGFDLLHESFVDESITRYRGQMHGKDSPPPYNEIDFVDKAGRRHTFEICSTSATYREKPTLIYFVRDITSEKKMRKALAEAENLYRTVLNTASDAKAAFALLQDVDGVEGKHVFVNDYYEELMRYRKEKLYRMSVFDLVSDADREITRDRYRRKMHGEDLPLYYEIECVTKDKTKITVGLSGAVASYQGKPAFIYYFKDITMEKILRDALEDYRLHLEDIADARTKALEEAHERIRRSEKLATIGQIAGTFAHEIRNPLGVIKNSAYYLDMALSDPDEKTLKHLSFIQQEISKVDKLISELLDFSRIKIPVKEDIILEALINGAIKKVNIPDRIEVAIISRNEDTSLSADSDQLERVFINLLTNAIDAIDDGGSIEVLVEDHDDGVAIMVKDTGSGINEDALPRIFEPLYSTKTQGVGLGLAICKQIVEAHGGDISVESSPDHGTTFTLYFPKVVLNE
ncbi:MAG: sensory histidine kinase AtoS [Candidatus Syntrophoarchaeum sp. GoM_oil]|nr:MAG: sensory histidine kinase AtoS [Candidatus Syntrophoarchaeum sp. GoM_oil]